MSTCSVIIGVREVILLELVENICSETKQFVMKITF